MKSYKQQPLHLKYTYTTRGLQGEAIDFIKDTYKTTRSLKQQKSYSQKELPFASFAPLPEIHMRSNLLNLTER